jgi:hypothetical protein
VVDVGARCAFVSVQSQVIGAQRVDGDQQDVTCGLWRARAQREQRESDVPGQSLDEHRIHGETVAARAGSILVERVPLVEVQWVWSLGIVGLLIAADRGVAVPLEVVVLYRVKLRTGVGGLVASGR